MTINYEKAVRFLLIEKFQGVEGVVAYPPVILAAESYQDALRDVTVRLGNPRCQGVLLYGQRADGRLYLAGEWAKEGSDRAKLIEDDETAG